MKCKCGADIVVYPQWGELAECMNCHRRYMIMNGEFILSTEDKLKDSCRQKLIEFQKSNKIDNIVEITQDDMEWEEFDDRLKLLWNHVEEVYNERMSFEEQDISRDKAWEMMKELTIELNKNKSNR